MQPPPNSMYTLPSHNSIRVVYFDMLIYICEKQIHFWDQETLADPAELDLQLFTADER